LLIVHRFDKLDLQYQTITITAATHCLQMYFTQRIQTNTQ